MGRGSTVSSPDGRRWRVRRRWLERPGPGLGRRFRDLRSEAAADGAVEGALEGFGADSLPAAIVIAVAAFVLILVVLPLIGVAIELIALIAVLAFGLFGRVVLGRPWIVEAVDLDDVENRRAFAVKGWRDSSAAVRELRVAIELGDPPDRLTVGEPLSTRPAIDGN